METKLTLKNISWMKLAGYLLLVFTIPTLIIYFGMSIIKLGTVYRNAELAGDLITPMTNESLAFLILIAMGIHIISFGLLFLNQFIMLYPFTKKDIMKTDVTNKPSEEAK